MKNKIFFIHLIFAILICGCQTLEINTPVDDKGTELKEQVIISFAWGIWNSPQKLTADNCIINTNDVNDLGLDVVNFKKNFGQTLVTVITFGIVSPSTISWKCNKPKQREEQ
jgi:hypothetical protein